MMMNEDDIEKMVESGNTIMGTKSIQDEKRDIEEIIEYGKKTLQKTKQLHPQFFIERPLKNGKYELTTAVLIFKDQEGKEMLLKQMRSIVQDANAEKAFLIMDGWITESKPGELPWIRPMRSVHRKEVLIAQEFRKDQTNAPHYHFLYKRGKDESISFEEKIELKEGTSITTWNPFIEYDGVAEKLDKSREEADTEFFKKQSKLIAQKYGKRIADADTDKKRAALAKEILMDMHRVKQSVDKQMYEDQENQEEDGEDEHGNN